MVKKYHPRQGSLTGRVTLCSSVQPRRDGVELLPGFGSTKHHADDGHEVAPPLVRKPQTRVYHHRGHTRSSLKTMPKEEKGELGTWSSKPRQTADLER